MKQQKKTTASPYRQLSYSADRVMVRFEKDNLKEVLSSQGGSFHLEVIKNGRVGTAVANQPDKESLFSKAVASAAFGDKVGFNYPAPQRPSVVRTYSQKVASLKPEDLVRIGKSLVKSVKADNQEILVDAFLFKLEGDCHLEHSQGLVFEQKETSLSISVVGELVSEGDVLQIEDSFDWGDQTFDLQKSTAAIRDKFRLSKKFAGAPSGKMTVVFTPEALSTLLGPIETALSAKSVYKGISKWAKELKKQVTDSRFSLIDDPSIDFALGSTRFDDEGSVVKPLALIENGVLKNFSTSAYFAATFSCAFAL